MKKFFEEWISHFRVEDQCDNDNASTKFSNDLVIQVNSDDDHKMSKIIAFSNSICQCLSFKRKKSDNDILQAKQKEGLFTVEKSTTTREMLKPQSADLKGKKTLILDLDETLVHSYFVPTKCDLYLEVPYQGKNLSFFINIRAGVDDFLEKMSQYYEIVIYTASMREYAEKVIDYLDKGNKVSHKLFRENCTFHQRGYVKDLSKINRELKDMIIIDNSPFSFAFQPENGILIKSFFDDTNDRELYNLMPFLTFLSKIHDVRPISQWEQKFNSDSSFIFRNMEKIMESYDHNRINLINSLDKKKKKLQLDLKQKKNCEKLRINYGESESAQKIKKNSIDENEEEDDRLEEKTTNAGEKNEQDGFEENRYSLDSTNINSPIIKKEIIFTNENKA